MGIKNADKEAVSESHPRRLRTSLIAWFVPLTVLPLIAFAALIYAFLSESLDQEIHRRSTPELATLSRNIENMERRLQRQTQSLSRLDHFRDAVASKNTPKLEQNLGGWMQASLFEEVRVFSFRGDLIHETSTRDVAKIQENWKSFFPAALENKLKKGSPSEKRNPAAAKGGPADPAFRLEGDRTLTSAFRRFLRDEDSVVVREVSAKDGVFRFLVYQSVYDDDYKPLGFVEAAVPFDEFKLKVLSSYQGVDLGLWTATLDPMGFSVEANGVNDWREAMKQFRSINTVREGKENMSFETKVSGRPVQFYLSPLSNEGQEPMAWLTLGLSKEDQVHLRQQVVLSLIVVGSLLLVLAIWLTVITSDRITKPVTDLVDATVAIREGKWVEPVASSGKNEIGILVRRFNDMALNVQVTKRALESKLDELAQAHTALTSTQDQLVQSAKMSSLGQLVAGVAHELNNPSAFIYSNMSQMRVYLKNFEVLEKLFQRLRETGDEKTRLELQRALDEVEWSDFRKDMDDMVRSSLEGSVRVKDIVLGLRNFSRLDKGEISRADLNSALKDTVKLLGGQLKNRVDVVWDLCARADVVCNVSQMNQVFMNLIANAIQAIEGKGQITIRTRFVNERNSVEVRIRDSGQGISADQLPKIFDPFYTTKKVGEGTGLGLSIVYGIMQKHGGNIRVVSEAIPSANHGTEFILEVPSEAVKESSKDDEQEAS